MNPIIKTENLCFSYKSESGEKAVLKDINLEIQRGSFTVVLGHNGSGKSTLAKHFNMILTPTSGKVYVNGHDTSVEDNLYEVRRCVGMVFQNPDNQLVATIVEDDIAFGPENLGIQPAEIRRLVDSALQSVGMQGFERHEPHRLSGGQKQRIAIAGVLAMSPECIILDESTAMLDPKGRREVVSTVEQLNREHGITVIMITHYMNEAVRANRVILLDNGRVLRDCPPRVLFAEPDYLRERGLDVPQSVELIEKLKKNGIDIKGSPVTPEQCAAAINECLSICDVSTGDM